MRLAFICSILVASSVTTSPVQMDLKNKKGNPPHPALRFVLHYCDWPDPSGLSEIQPTFVVQYKGGVQKYIIATEQGIHDMIAQLYKDGVVTNMIAFIIHGYENGITSSWLYEIADALSAVEDYTIFIVAWDKGADFWTNFGQAAANTQPVADAVALAVQSMREKSSPYIHCIGHSLGAHVCGQAGLSSKLDRISGLDPAGPGFADCPKNTGLSNNSADCVDVIHTNGESINGFGTLVPLGHIDFYPNCGISQPACSIWDMFVGCSHHMAIDYYTDSIKSFTSKTAQHPASQGPCEEAFIDKCKPCGWGSCPDSQPVCSSEPELSQSIGYGSVCHHHKKPGCCSAETRDNYFGSWYVPMTKDGDFASHCPASSV